MMYSGKTPYDYLSKYRTELMGLAILWVLWLHSAISFDYIKVGFLQRGLFFLQQSGYGGVDIFLLLSGIGVFHSLQKNSTGTFYKNRIRRIVPTCWLFVVIEIILGLLSLISPMKPIEILGYATFTGYWFDLNNQGNWYIYAIALFYLISPLLYYLLRRAHYKTRAFLWMILAAFLISFCFFGSLNLMVFSRLPVFILGFLISARKEYPKMDRKKWILCACCCLCAFLVLYYVTGHLGDLLWNYGLWWYPFFVIAPTLSLLLGKLMEVLENKTGWLRRGLRALGNASLEILLTSDILIFKCYYLKESLPFSLNMSKRILIIVSILIGLLIHFFISRVEHRLTKKPGEKPAIF